MKSFNIKNELYIVLLVLSLLFGCNRNSTKNSNAIFNSTNVFSELTNDTIYLKSKTWGLTSNHKIILIRNYFDEDFKYDSLHDIQIKGEDYIFYELKLDSLILYLEHPVDIPVNFSSKTKVKQVALKGSEFRNLFENHKSLGVDIFD